MSVGARQAGRGIRRGTLALSMSLSLYACAGLGGAEGTAGSVDAGDGADGADGLGDSGAITGLDAGGLDADGAPDELGYDLGAGGAAPGVGLFEGRSSDADDVCFDGIDNDGNGLLDCAEDSCASLVACCVGDGSCCLQTLQSTLPPVLDFECLGDPAACLSALGATPFGSPFFRGAGLAPGGDGAGEDGIVLEPPVDLRSHRVQIDASLGGASACADTCLEGVGVSFSAAETFVDAMDVPIVAGLVLSGARAEISLVVHDAVIARRPFDPASSYRLILQPDGQVHALEGSIEWGSASFEPSVARLIVHGHSRNPDLSVAESARVRSLSLSVDVCDIPERWSEPEPIVSRAGSAGLVALAGIGRPTLGYDGLDRATVAFARGGEIFLAKRPGLDPSELTLTGALDNPALSAGRDHDRDGLEDPCLLWDPVQARWVLFYIGLRAGLRQLGRAEAAETDAIFTPDPSAVLLPEAGAELGWARPSAVIHPDGNWILLLEAIDSAGVRRPRFFLSADAGHSFTPIAGSGLEAALDPPPDSALRFASDEIGEMSLIIHHGLYQLYYARRLGTRWSIGLLVSADLRSWRHLAEGEPVLLPSARSEESVGVRGPALGLRGELLELFYLGDDGLTTRLMRRSRAALDR